ncbi:hypothetical protein BC834DRAFT_45573 [Gloeopeniophorella convolvens]|nr:hypothetical protein BC834DRAFT_45573 [Gloeopeniophorella convolvens]
MATLRQITAARRIGCGGERWWRYHIMYLSAGCRGKARAARSHCSTAGARAGELPSLSWSGLQRTATSLAGLDSRYDFVFIITGKADLRTWQKRRRETGQGEESVRRTQRSANYLETNTPCTLPLFNLFRLHRRPLSRSLTCFLSYPHQRNKSA